MSVIEREQQQVDPAREGRARVLEAAALEIEVRGWARGALSGRWWNGGRVCIMGAIGAATETGLISGDLPNSEVCAKAWGNACGYRLWIFNDGRARDAQEVTFVLRWRAAEIRDGR